MQFDPGFDISIRPDELSFQYGPGVSGPEPEFRTLDAIRASLRNTNCDGPEIVYGIAMDVARTEDLRSLNERMLLFGAVVYAAGHLGDEPVRSQGHIHAISPHSGWSAPEWFEVWEGTAIIYAQQSAGADAGTCVAITAHAGEQVVVPPAWAHCVINASPSERMAFGALCDRQYGFEYADIRRHHGLAWFPLLSDDGTIRWERNESYFPNRLLTRGAREYSELGITSRQSIYHQFLNNPDSVQWVSEPGQFQNLWPSFVP